MRTFFFCLCVLLIGTAKGDEKKINPKATEGQEKVTLTCEGGIWVVSGEKVGDDTLNITYDSGTYGEYQCHSGPDPDIDNLLGTIYVKTRMCKNCIELDEYALAGIIIGNVVATALIGIAVYSISTQSKGPSFPSNKASQESDRRNLIPNDSTYQSLTNSGRDAYEVLHTRRR